MEVRLNKRQKIKQLFKKLNIKLDLTFKKLFKPAISKKILLHYLDELENRRPPLIDYSSSNDKALLTDLIFNNPEFSANKILQIFGFKKALEIVNLRELRNLFGNQKQNSWYRLISDTNKVKLAKQESSLKPIIECLEKFNTIKLS